MARVARPSAIVIAWTARRSSVSFALGTFTATCKTSTVKAKVIRNPSRPGKARLSVIGQTFGKCSLSTNLATLKSITAVNLPYGATISDAKRDPVTITESRKSRPLGFKAVIMFNGTTLTCAYTAAKASGHASNTGNKVSFAAQKFTLNQALSSSNLCSAAASTATFSATYGPVLDTSVRHHPKVFIS